MAWIPIPKPTESSVVTFANDGQPFGLLIAITRDTQTVSVVSGWTDVNKPLTANWTSVPKPTP